MTRGGGASRKRTGGGRSQSEKLYRPPCTYFLKGICTKSPCEYWHPPECHFLSKGSCKFGDKCSFACRQIEGQPSKKPEKDGDKSAVAFLKNVRQLGCVFQDTEPPGSLSILQKSTKALEPIRRVRFKKSYAASCNRPRKQRTVARKNSSQSSSSAQSRRYEI